MTDFEERMRGLRARFLARLAEDVAMIEATLVPGHARADAEAMQERAHKLAGLSGSVGFPEVSAAAKALDRGLDEINGDPGTLQELVDDLARAARSAQQR